MADCAALVTELSCRNKTDVAWGSLYGPYFRIVDIGALYMDICLSDGHGRYSRVSTGVPSG